MLATRFDFDRVTLIALAASALLPLIAVTPARAETVDCAAAAQQLRTEAQAADPQAAAKALKTVRLAEKICAEGNRFEAGKKFTLARAQLGSDVQMAAAR